MSHFYGTLQGTRGKATRCGHKGSGMTTQAAGWGGAIETRVYHDKATGLDCFEVRMIQWRGAGDSVVIAAGVIGDSGSIGFGL